MSAQIEPTSSQNDNKTIASSDNHSLASSSSSSSSSSANDKVAELACPTIVTNISKSNNVHIDNSSTNTYHITNHVYQQHDNVEQLSVERSAEQKNVFSKTYCSIFQIKDQGCSRQHYVAISVLLLILVVPIVTLMIWLFDSMKSHADTIPNVTSSESVFRIVYKREWNGKPPKNATESLRTQPPSLVILHDTYTGLCYFQEQCSVYMRLIQNDHMEITHDWNDIGYNFLVGGDGLVYEGRGWNVVGAHTRGYNSYSIGIGIIGSFEKEIPTKVQLESTKKLIEYGVENQYISSNYILLGRKQCGSSASPGTALYNIIKTWTHWSSVCPKI